MHTTRLVCAVAFCLFSLCWLYFFQADTLAVAQHVLSEGVTHYNRTVGAVLITLALQAIQLMVFAVTRLERRTHALTYLPSMLALAWLTDISPDITTTRYSVHWLWIAPLVLIVWGFVVWVARKTLPVDEGQHPMPNGLLSRRTWINLLQMVAMMTAVALLAGTDAVFHFRAHAEEALQQGDDEEALRTGSRSLETDASLTMLRAFALSRQGRVGECLFNYAVAGRGCDLLPLHSSASHLLMLPDTLLWDHLGLRPDSMMTFYQYLDTLRARIGANASERLDSEPVPTLGGVGSYSERLDSGVISPSLAWRDYLLTAYLIDRRLDLFATAVGRLYPIATDSLPTHYREALALIAWQNDLVLTTDTATARRWAIFQQQDSIWPSPRERRIRIEEDFGKTYWYYYYFSTSNNK